MSVRVGVRIDKYLDGESLEQGAVVSIRQLLDTGHSGTLMRIPVPVGSDVSRVHSVELVPGRYEFSALLPSGAVTSRVVEIGTADAAPVVTLEAEDSAHEWLSWQQWSGNASSRSSMDRLQGQLSRAPERLRRSLDGLTVSLWRIPTPGLIASDPVSESLGPALAQLGEGDTVSPQTLLPPGVISEPVELLRDSPYCVARLPKGAVALPGRAYLIVTQGAHSMLCSMPWPWQQTDGSGEALVEAVIAIDEERIEGAGEGGADAAGAAEPPWSVRPSVRDKLLGGLLGYFGSGEQSLARELLEPARELLFYKNINPIAAAAGAHLLVGEWIRGTAQGPTAGPWIEWVSNLRRQFAWLPDGALLDGWLALRRRDKAPDIDAARQALLEAERRGVPLYTMGIRRLVDGLLLVSSADRERAAEDTQVTQALARVRRLAWQVDPRQPFTCIRLWSS